MQPQGYNRRFRPGHRSPGRCFGRFVGRFPGLLLCLLLGRYLFSLWFFLHYCIAIKHRTTPYSQHRITPLHIVRFLSPLCGRFSYIYIYRHYAGAFTAVFFGAVFQNGWPWQPPLFFFLKAPFFSESAVETKPSRSA